MGQNFCSFKGCGRAASTKGLCRSHYKQQWQGKDLKPLKPYRPNVGKVCTFPGCGLGATCKGLCQGHYVQHRRGQVMRPLRDSGTNTVVGADCASVELSLTNRHGMPVAICVIDLADLGRVRALGRIHRDGNGYARVGDVQLGRILLGIEDSALYCDHIDGDRLNNRRSNLRAVTPAENAQNVARPGRERARGVSRRSRGGRRPYQVDVMVNGVSHYGGVFATEDEAVERARALRAELMTHANEDRHQ